MQVLIIEDEYHAARRLEKLLLELQPDIQILATIDSIEDAVNWLQQNPEPELAFMDIQLADGLSFEIFKQIKFTAPVIFTTAFDQYTLQAFKVNSIDYLLKPIEEEELATAIQKFQTLFDQNQPFDSQSLMQAIQSFQTQKSFKQRFLLKQGQSWHYLPITDVAYLYSEDSMTFLVDLSGKRHLLNTSLEQLQDQLDPNFFFRINRSQMIHIQSVRKVDNWFNHRVKVQLEPDTGGEYVVSRNRVKGFKEWLGG